MWVDPIVAEVRRIRDQHAAKFNYDLDAIFRDIKEEERKSGDTFVTFPPRSPQYYGPADPLLASNGAGHAKAASRTEGGPSTDAQTPS
jgi:hypothetical protein